MQDFCSPIVRYIIEKELRRVNDAGSEKKANR